jgi:hypothetical protein
MCIVILVSKIIVVGGMALVLLIEQFPESRGLYYKLMEEARLYIKVFNVLSYIDLSQINRNFENMAEYVKLIQWNCHKHET